MFCLLSIIPGLLVAIALEYPIDPSLLNYCAVYGYENRQGFLCRPPADFSQETQAYIRDNLWIKDLDFYDVFEESEIYKFFPPQRDWKGEPPFKIYLWDDMAQARQAILNAGSDQSAGYSTFYEDLKVSSWRTLNKSEALLHYIALPWNYKVIEHNDKFQKSSATRYLDKILRSPEWKQFNGTNFFTFWSDWPTSFWARRYNKDHFLTATEPSANKSAFYKDHDTVDSWDFVRLHMSGLNYQTIGELRECMPATNLDIHDQFKSLRYWPDGPLESYRYPLGNYAQLLANRKHNLFFVVSVDGRPAYDWRWTTLNNITGFRPPSFVSHRVKRVFHPRPYDGPACRGDIWQDCQLQDQYEVFDAFPEWAINSKYGLHVRGDDWFSSRTGEVLASAGILIIIDDETWTFTMGDQSHMPLRDIAITIPGSLFWANPKRQLEEALNSLSHHQIEKKLRLLEYYRKNLFFGIAEANAAESRLVEYVNLCLPATVTGHFGLDKRSLVTPFQYWNSLNTFTAAGDEDDQTPPWSPSWYKLYKAGIPQDGSALFTTSGNTPLEITSLSSADVEASRS